MELRKYPDPILSKKCAAVREGDPELSRILEEMSQKLYEWEGAGLAAPQVGILKRMAVIDIRTEPKTLYKLVNPEIVWASEDMAESEEGCLSLPVLRAKIMRYESVVVYYRDENFAEREICASGFLSCCLQHELDHLDGVLYTDHLSKLKRKRALREFERLQTEKLDAEKPESEA
jgi:peptide deformylase